MGAMARAPAKLPALTPPKPPWIPPKPPLAAAGSGVSDSNATIPRPESITDVLSRILKTPSQRKADFATNDNATPLQRLPVLPRNERLF
jgi:hypothetical protein